MLLFAHHASSPWTTRLCNKEISLAFITLHSHLPCSSFFSSNIHISLLSYWSQYHANLFTFLQQSTSLRVSKATSRSKTLPPAIWLPSPMMARTTIQDRAPSTTKTTALRRPRMLIKHLPQSKPGSQEPWSLPRTLKPSSRLQHASL
jgi:hypothetical protein